MTDNLLCPVVWLRSDRRPASVRWLWLGPHEATRVLPGVQGFRQELDSMRRARHRGYNRYRDLARSEERHGRRVSTRRCLFTPRQHFIGVTTVAWGAIKMCSFGLLALLYFLCVVDVVLWVHCTLAKITFMSRIYCKRLKCWIENAQNTVELYVILVLLCPWPCCLCSCSVSSVDSFALWLRLQFFVVELFDCY